MTTENRARTGQFQPGQSGNPGGRPAKIAELSAACRELTPKILETVTGILLNEEARDADRLSAARLLTEYGFGKPNQAVQLDVCTNVTEMDRDELRKQIAELEAKKHEI